MTDLVFVDPSFDKNKTKEYTLSIQVGLDGFSFSVLDGNKNCIALHRFQSFPKNNDSNTPANLIKETIRNHELLNLSFKEVAILWVSPKSTLIPSEFFSEDFAYESFQLCHKIEETESLHWNELHDLNSWIVFSIPKSLNEFFVAHFTKVKLYHNSYPFFKEALKNPISDNHPSVFVDIQNDFFHAIIPDKTTKHFINTFVFNEETDLAYFILNLFKQQKLNNERSKLILSGMIQEESKLTQLLKKYLGQVEVKLLSAKYRVNNKIPHKEYNQFINLLNLSRCE